MPLTIEQRADEAMKLPSEARAQLADRLVESLDAAELSRTEKLWAAESCRRLDEILQEKVETIPGDEVLARARRLAAE